MKDIKKAYDEIKISDKEKNKIFNNIMEKRKKSFSWGPIFGFGALAAASFGMFMVLNKNSDPTKPNDPTNPGVLTVVNRNVGLENNYRKEIITGAKKYLEANKIEIDEIPEGEELIIKGEEIVKSEDYGVCKGNLVIKRYNDDFSYSTDVTCEGEDTDLSDAKEYIIYSGTLTNVFELKYGIAVASISNVKKPNFDVVDCDANLIVMDNDGNIKFNKTIESPYKDEDSTVKVINVKKINEKYYLILEIANEIHFEADGSGSLRNHYYIMTLDEDGEELSYQEMLEDGNSIFVENIIGGDAYKISCTGYVLDKETFDTTNVIIEIAEDQIKTIPYKVVDEGVGENMARHTVITDYESNNFYGYKYDKSYAGANKYSANILFKMNDKAEEVWETKLDGFNIIKVKVDTDLVYVLANNGSISRIYTYNTDGQKKGTVDLKDFHHVADFAIEGKKIIVKGTDKKGNEFFEIFNENLEMEEKIEIDNSDIKKNFEYSYMQYAKLENKKITAGYTVNKNLSQSDEVLLVFNK